MAKHPGVEVDQVDGDLVWWLVKMGRQDRATYRKLRALAWDLVLANKEHSENPNERS